MSSRSKLALHRSPSLPFQQTQPTESAAAEVARLISLVDIDLVGVVGCRYFLFCRILHRFVVTLSLLLNDLFRLAPDAQRKAAQTAGESRRVWKRCRSWFGNRLKASILFIPLNHRPEETAEKLLSHNTPFLPLNKLPHTLDRLVKDIFRRKREIFLTLIQRVHCKKKLTITILRGGSNSGLSVPPSFPKRYPFP